jgi:hypothetical protein
MKPVNAKPDHLDIRTLKLTFVGCFAMITLTSCGDGETSAPAGQVISTQSFPLQIAMKTSIERGSSTNFAASVIVSAGICRGASNIDVSTPVPATFEGVSGVSAANTVTTNYVNCYPTSIIGTATDYYDTNYVPLGRVFAGSDYRVYQSRPTLPGYVKVGDKGTIGTQDNFTDSTKNEITGQHDISYVVEPDTANTAIFNIIDKSYSGGILLSTEQDRYRIEGNGTLAPVSLDRQTASEHYIFTAMPDTSPSTALPANPPSK